MKLIPAMAALLVLGGCAALSPESADPAADAAALKLYTGRVAELETVNGWQIRGRLGLRTQDRGGSATLIWDREGQNHRIDLYGPFGSGKVQIIQDEIGAVLRDGKDKTWVADSAAEALFVGTGWHVPFDELTRWIVGLPFDSGVGAENIDDQGMLVALEDSGWQIEYLDYTRRDELSLPQRVFATASETVIRGLVNRHGESLTRLEVKLVINSWVGERRKPSAR